MISFVEKSLLHRKGGQSSNRIRIVVAGLLGVLLLSLVPLSHAYAVSKTTTIPVGNGPRTVAVNSRTHQVAVASLNGTVTVIEASGAASTIAVGQSPNAISVNPVTNKIYVANTDSNSVSVIDGAVNTANTQAVGQLPLALATNPVTSLTYVANAFGNTVSVLDALGHTTATIPVGSFPTHVAVNPITNKIYVTNSSSNTITVIDGATNRTSTIATGVQPSALELNPITGNVYVGNATGNNVTVITPNALPNTPAPLSFMPLAGNRTASATPTITILQSTASTLSSLPVRQVYFQFDSQTGPWKRANKSGNNWTAQPSTLRDGIHILYVYASDGQDATSDNTGPNTSPLISQIASYLFAKGEEAGDEVPIIFAPTDLPTASVGDTYTQHISASGDGPYRFAAMDGNLPNGIRHMLPDCHAGRSRGSAVAATM